MQSLNPQQISHPLDYNSLWLRNCFSFDLDHDSDQIQTNLSLKNMIALSWLIGLRNRVAVTKQSLIITVEGAHRSGKSIFSAVDLGMIFDASYFNNMKTRVVQTAEDLLDLIKVLQDEKILNPVIIIDEAGASMASSDWFERIQKAVIKTMQIIGFLHPIIIFIAPIQDQIASGLRKMSHVFIRVVRKSNKYTKLYPATVSYDSRTKKYYYPRPRVKVFGTTYTIPYIKITMPPRELVAMYEQIEQARKPLMLEDIRQDSKMNQIKKQKEMFDYDKTAEFCTKNLERYETRRSRKAINEQFREISLDLQMIRHDFKCTASQASIVKRLAEEKINKTQSDIQGAIL